jgi:hypothetical protein
MILTSGLGESAHMTLSPHRVSAQRIAINQCAYFERQYPALRELGLDVRMETADAAFNVYIEHIKLLDPVAADLARIEMYRQLVELPPESGLKRGPARALAQLYVKRGQANHALKLIDRDDPLRIEVQTLIQRHSKAYGREFDTQTFKGLTRGFSLLHYFSAHPHLLKGRHIAHVGPETELRAWISEMSKTFNCTYIAVDGFQPGMDRYEDLCSMGAEDSSFDTIICHRVLEHVIDGPSAYKELFRVLRPGGVLNYSVPEALYLDKTVEWIIPDPKFHGHVRMYGRDFPRQLESVGFRVERADWLLGRPVEELQAVRAYPMLLYNAYKE